MCDLSRGCGCGLTLSLCTSECFRFDLRGSKKAFNFGRMTPLFWGGGGKIIGSGTWYERGLGLGARMCLVLVSAFWCLDPELVA